MFKANDGTNITLISVIMGIINSSFDFSNPSYLFPFITMVCIILFSLMVIISTLFSVGDKALKRNVWFSGINYIVLILCNGLSILFDARISYGSIVVIVVYMLEIFFHFLVHIKLNKSTKE